MPPFVDANPAVSSEWPRWDEDGDGDLDPQVEFARAAQFGVGTFLGKPAYRFTVAPGDVYRGSTGLRCLARFWPKPREGESDAFHHEFGFPEGTVFPDTWVNIWEAHGPGGVVAPVRLLVRPGGRLMLAFNSGTLSGGNATGWTAERHVATVKPGVLYVLRGEITWDPDNGEGQISLKLNGQEIVPPEWAKHGTAQEQSGQPFLAPYILVGLYTGTDLPEQITLMVPRSVWADSLQEIDVALRRMPDARVDRMVLRALAFKGRACDLAEIKGSWGLDEQDVDASLARLSALSLVEKPAGDPTKWGTADSKAAVRSVRG